MNDTEFARFEKLFNNFESALKFKGTVCFYVKKIVFALWEQ